VGIHEMKPYLVREDLGHWEQLLNWIEPERVLADQPAPLAEQPQPQVAQIVPEAIDTTASETGVHDARFIVA
jgi:hypothetical protein